MKTLLYTLSFVLVSTWGVAQINTNSTRSNSFGDLQLRRHNGGDTAWKRALVVGYDKSNKNSRLYINYGGDFNLGTRINGPTVSINGNVGIGTTTPAEKLHVNGGAIIRKSSFSRTQGSHENSWIRDDWLTGNHGAPVWNQTKKRWIRPLGTYNDFGGIIWQDEGVYFIKQDRGTKTEFTNDEMLNNAFLFAHALTKNIGIGTTNPDQKLTVQGHVNIGGTRNATLRVRHIEGKHYENATYDNLHLNYSSGKDVYVGNPHNSNLYSNLLVTGNVGIGTTNPKEKLSVNGNIRAKEVKVEIENWPDYVFKADYDLPSLEDVKKHIAAKGHLPNMPSATVIKEQGAALGALNVKLLEKIEELTLYTLDQETQLQQQQHTINTLMERLSQIESKLNHHEKPTP